jgi:TetR/AcrR family transcriptional regulator, cholesterol catabolism regulator
LNSAAFTAPPCHVPSTTAKTAKAEQLTAKYSAKYLRVLQEAARLFSERGYHVATTKDIADALGVQQGSLYYYIRSKDSALEEICLYAIEGYVAFSAEIRQSRAAPRDKVAQVFQRHLGSLEVRPEFFKVFLAHRHDLGDGARHEIGRQIREYEANVEAILRSGVRKGDFRKDLDCRLTTLAILGMCNAVASWWGKRADGPVSEIARKFTDVMLGGIEAAPGGR